MILQTFNTHPVRHIHFQLNKSFGWLDWFCQHCHVHVSMTLNRIVFILRHESALHSSMHCHSSVYAPLLVSVHSLHINFTLSLPRIFHFFLNSLIRLPFHRKCWCKEFWCRAKTDEGQLTNVGETFRHNNTTTTKWIPAIQLDWIRHHCVTKMWMIVARKLWGATCANVQCTHVDTLIESLCITLTLFYNIVHSLTLCYNILQDDTLSYNILHYFTLFHTFSHYFTLSFSHCQSKTSVWIMMWKLIDFKAESRKEK